MAVKQKYLYLNMNLEVICLCEVGGISRSRIAGWNGFNFSDIVHCFEEERQNMITCSL
jgi:hypothetical protein